MWFGSADRRYDGHFGHRHDRYDRYDDWHDRGDYWHVAKQPLAILCFLLPLIAAYELGAHYISTGNADPVRNGADYWIRTSLADLGGDQPWLLPAVVLGALVLWQVVGQYRWKISGATLLGMLIESAIFGFCLVLIGEVQEMAFQQLQPVPHDAPRAAIDVPHARELTRAISFLGAGIYEEVLFRAAILPICYLVFRVLLPHGMAVFLAIVVSSLLFSGAHYVGPAADEFNTFGFVFRAIAGAFFAVVMVLRGFGITVGTHAAYDIFVGILLPAKLLETWMAG
ncbi:MAG: CPBP family intramembrane metalloprotease [Planctomycetaceae bacterium]|nr:MAG: CPBP family intramembrane metalloprotease [Planctomycetaceae bacterium]